MRETLFHTDACIDLPPLAARRGCGCALHARRRLGGALIGSGLAAALGSRPAWAQNAPPAPVAGGRDPECKRSTFTNAVPAEDMEQAARQQYQQMLGQAQQQRALAPLQHPQMQRLRYIAERIIPYTNSCNKRARNWQWEVNLLGSQELNAFCMPGGKIAFYLGILQKLQLDDDEVAVIMGHEVSHALLEHARERAGKSAVTRGVIEIGSALLGLGGLARSAADIGAQLLTLRFSRDDESEADALGLVLSARAGYQPQAGVSLWQKMLAASKGAPPKWLSTHPPGDERIRSLQALQPRAQALYAAAAKPTRRFAPPKA